MFLYCPSCSRTAMAVTFSWKFTMNIYFDFDVRFNNNIYKHRLLVWLDFLFGWSSKTISNDFKYSMYGFFSLQAVIIAFTSEFIPKLVYRYGYSDDQTLNGYTNFSLSVFATKDFQPQSVPLPSVISDTGNVTECRLVCLPFTNFVRVCEKSYIVIKDIGNFA